MNLITGYQNININMSVSGEQLVSVLQSADQALDQVRILITSGIVFPKTLKFNT